MIPIQKLGIDWPNIASVMIPPSTAVPRYSAAKTPNGMASEMARNIENSVNSIVAGNAPSTIPMAGCR